MYTVLRLRTGLIYPNLFILVILEWRQITPRWYVFMETDVIDNEKDIFFKQKHTHYKTPKQWIPLSMTPGMC